MITDSDIYDVIEANCIIHPHYKAALELTNMGVTEEEFVRASKKFRAIPDNITIGVQNFIRDIERSQKYGPRA